MPHQARHDKSVINRVLEVTFILSKKILYYRNKYYQDGDIQCIELVSFCLVVF